MVGTIITIGLFSALFFWLLEEPMIKFFNKHKEFTIEDIDIKTIEIQGIHHDDFPDFCDAFISYAEFKDGTVLNDSQLDKLMDDNECLVNELIHENQLYI